MYRHNQPHWTQDPRLRHLRSPPEWYQRRVVPFWTPKPSARMEKHTAIERKRQWQWQAVDSSGDAINESCLEATCWPCGLYARTMVRLHSALAGRNAEFPPEPGLCNADCFQYTVCLPCYGFFLSRLQATTRSFYGIDGLTQSDWFDSCYCPCLTLVRNEQEIIIRERQYFRLKSLHDSSSFSTSQYQPPSPMTCNSSPTKSSTPQTSNTSRTNSQNSTAQTAPQSSAAPTTTSQISTAQTTSQSSSSPTHPSPPTASGTNPAKLAARSSSKFVETPGNTALGKSVTAPGFTLNPADNTVDVPVVHYLDHEWYMVPVSQADKQGCAKGDQGSSAAAVTDGANHEATSRGPVPITATLVRRHSLSQHKLGALDVPKQTGSHEKEKVSQTSPCCRLPRVDEDESEAPLRPLIRIDPPTPTQAIHDATQGQDEATNQTIGEGTGVDAASNEANRPGVPETNKDAESEEAPR